MRVETTIGYEGLQGQLPLRRQALRGSVSSISMESVTRRTRLPFKTLTKDRYTLLGDIPKVRDDPRPESSASPTMSDARENTEGMLRRLTYSMAKLTPPLQLTSGIALL